LGNDPTNNFNRNAVVAASCARQKPNGHNRVAVEKTCGAMTRGRLVLPPSLCYGAVSAKPNLGLVLGFESQSLQD
jgi:hypothetical protein